MSCPCPVPYYLHSRTGQDFFLIFFYPTFLLSLSFESSNDLLRRMLLLLFSWNSGAKVGILGEICVPPLRNDYVSG